jgi:hypothetical protein
MTDPKETAASKGVEGAWDFWLSQHPISVPDIIEMAVTAAVASWLNDHDDVIIDAIKEATERWLAAEGIELIPARP